MAKNHEKPNQSLQIPGIIVIAAKFLSFISTKLTVSFAARLFTTPIRHKTPKRELEMDRKSRQKTIMIPTIGKSITVYEYGESARKVLLAHGWSGRGTQLVRLADALLDAGFSTVSFDAPAHGKSTGKTTLLPEFIDTILEIDRLFGPFEAAVGHSLGGMALLNATARGLKIGRLVTIGSGDIIKDITDDFVRQLGLGERFGELLRAYFEQKHEVPMDAFSSWHSAQKIDIPVLVIHDENDGEVPVRCAEHIHANLKRGTLLVTKNLGHRKILGNQKVIETTLQFIQS